MKTHQLKNKSDKNSQSATLVAESKNDEGEEDNVPEDQDPLLLLDEDEVCLAPRWLHMDEFGKNLYVGIVHTEF
jgi:hypothetical protein